MAFQVAPGCSGLFSLLRFITACSGCSSFYKRRLHRVFFLAKLLKMNFVLDFIIKLDKDFYKVEQL